MPEVWIKAKHENWGLILKGADWEYDLLTVYQTGAYHIEVNKAGKLKTYKGKLSVKRHKELLTIAEHIREWDDTNRDRLPEILGWVCDGTHWSLEIRFENGDRTELDWQVLEEDSPIDSFLAFYQTMRKNAKLVKMEDIFFPE